MPWHDTKVWVDEENGPAAFTSVVLFNQKLWDDYPDRADESIGEALATGGFDSDHIRRRVGNYEGQIMAIRRGYARKDADTHCWLITDEGRKFLSDRGKPVPDFLWARDDWHASKFEFCIWQIERAGSPYLKFAKELYPRTSVGMNPLFGVEDAMALRDYLDAWLAASR